MGDPLSKLVLESRRGEQITFENRVHHIDRADDGYLKVNFDAYDDPRKQIVETYGLDWKIVEVSA